MERVPGDRNLLGGSEQTTTQTGGYSRTPESTFPRVHEYDVALCCLFFLRALRHTSDFFLSCSNTHIVLFYRPKGDESLKYRAIFLQAKHTTQKTLTASDPFSLEEYLDSFREIRKQWDQPVKVKGQLIEFQEMSLVLYTNIECAVSDAAHDVTASPDVEHLRDILNTGGRLLRISDALLAGLPQGPETSDFIGHFILFTEQANVEKADHLLEEEISKVLRLTSSNYAEKLILNLKLMFMNWWREEGENRYLSAQSEEWRRVLEVSLLNADNLTINNQLNFDFTKAALEEGQKAFRIGEHQEHLERVKLLIQKGADPNLKAEDGKPVLMGAAFKGHLEVVKLLIQMGADPNLQAQDGVSALMAAARQGHLEVVKLLIEMGADLNLKTEDGETALMGALMGAADKGHMEVVKLLVEMGADTKLKTKCGETALLVASCQGCLEVVKVLINKGADPNVKEINGITALMAAAGQGHVEVVKLLIEMGADPNLKSEDGETALMVAARQGRLDVLKLLIEMGADSNLKDEFGNNALMGAARKGHLEVVQLLVEMCNIIISLA